MNFNALSVAYADRIQVLANCLTRAKQVENVDLQSSSPTLSYTIIREGMYETTNMRPIVEAIDSYIDNICTS